MNIIIGYLMIAMIFVALFIYVWKEDGFKTAIGITFAVAILHCWVHLAFYLIG